MIVRALELSGFMSHAASRVELPERGVLVVRGPNGAGKSALVEAVAAACWGESLRGEPGWVDGRGRVFAELAGLGVARERASREEVAWSLDAGWTVVGTKALAPFPGPLDERFETATKAQPRLDLLVGSFETWRRTRVFSAGDAARFALATDGERKRLIEGLLSLERCDGALAACRADLAAAEERESRAARREERARARIASAEERAERARAALADASALSFRPPPAPRAFDADLALARRLASGAEAALGEAERGCGHARAARAQRERERALVAGGLCTACGQAVDEPLLERFRRAAEGAVDELRLAEEAREVAAADLAELRDELAVLEARAERARRARREVELRAEEAERAGRVRARAEGELDAALVEAEEARVELDAARLEAEGAARAMGELRAGSAALGLRGFRAQVLGRSLVGLSALANVWLGRLGMPDLAVEVRPYEERKKGGTVDAISVEVRGAGGGRYRGASSGERRRIDAALVVALGELAAGAAGAPPGTLWFDELFDAIDDEGVDAVAGALAALAEERCVVAITHSEPLAARLPAAKRIRVEKGKVIEL